MCRIEEKQRKKAPWAESGATRSEIPQTRLGRPPSPGWAEPHLARLGQAPQTRLSRPSRLGWADLQLTRLGRVIPHSAGPSHPSLGWAELHLTSWAESPCPGWAESWRAHYPASGAGLRRSGCWPDRCLQEATDRSGISRTGSMHWMGKPAPQRYLARISAYGRRPSQSPEFQHQTSSSRHPAHTRVSYHLPEIRSKDRLTRTCTGNPCPAWLQRTP